MIDCRKFPELKTIKGIVLGADFISHNPFLLNDYYPLRYIQGPQEDKVIYLLTNNAKYVDSLTTYYDMESLVFRKSEFESAIKKSDGGQKISLKGKRVLDLIASEDGLYGGPCFKCPMLFDVDIEFSLGPDDKSLLIDYNPKDNPGKVESYRAYMDTLQDYL